MLLWHVLLPATKSQAACMQLQQASGRTCTAAAVCAGLPQRRERLPSVLPICTSHSHIRPVCRLEIAVQVPARGRTLPSWSR